MIPGLPPWPLSCLAPVTLLESSYQVYGSSYASCTKIPKTCTWEPNPCFLIPAGSLGVPQASWTLLQAHHLKKCDPHPMFPVSVGQTRNLDVTSESFLSLLPHTHSLLFTFFPGLFQPTRTQSDLPNTEVWSCLPLI